MPILGTIVNGEVKLDQPCTLPEGFRVELVPEDLEDFESGPLMPEETYEEHLTILREAIAEKEAGVQGYTVQEAFTMVHAELKKRRSLAGR